MTYLNMEAVVDMHASLIWSLKNIKILDEECKEIILMDEQEKTIIGTSQVEPYLMHYIDVCGFAEISTQMDISNHKNNIKNRTAIREQILIIHSGVISWRGVNVQVGDDQNMLKNSVWNQKPGAIVEETEKIAGDAGYWSTQNVNVVKPISQADVETDPGFKAFNKKFNYDRGLIEHSFAILKGKFKIFDLPWTRHKDLFPLALRVCLKLLNKWWRVDGNDPPGLQRYVQIASRL